MTTRQLSRLLSPVPTLADGAFHWGWDTAKAVWSGAVQSGLILGAVAWLVPKAEAAHGWQGFALVMLVCALKEGLRLYTEPKPPP